MADAEAKAKLEKLAAAKKRVEQLKKQKAKKAEAKAEEPPASPSRSSKPEAKLAVEVPSGQDDPTLGKADDAEVVDESSVDVPIPESIPPAAHSPSISLQSKLRSSSFRQSSGPLSPGIPGISPILGGDGDTAPDIYRKQAARIDELEKENKRLAKEATEGEKRWKKAEEELEVLREAEGESTISKSAALSSIGLEDENQKLKLEIAALQRQNIQLQAQASRLVRHGSSPSIIGNGGSAEDLAAELASKSSTIESMEIEISNLQAQLARNASGSTAEKEQITALEGKVSRIQKSYDTSQRELLDLKKNLDRTTEKAVKEGSERTSAETKLKTLTRQAEDGKTQVEELQKKIDGLEKKVLTLTTLHKEHDARSQTLKRERERADKETIELRKLMGSLENDNLRMREERERIKKRDAQGVDDDGVDELENEERQRLERRVRDLEAETFELRRGAWKDRRKEIDGDEPGLTSPGGKFTEVDLNGGNSPVRRRSVAGASKGLGDLFASSFSAFTGAVAGDEPLLEDDEMDFDEDAFRAAQEEESRKRIERVRELKRALNDWKGWRMDLVEARRAGGEGTGEIFEV